MGYSSVPVVYPRNSTVKVLRKQDSDESTRTLRQDTLESQRLYQSADGAHHGRPATANLIEEVSDSLSVDDESGYE